MTIAIGSKLAPALGWLVRIKCILTGGIRDPGPEIGGVTPAVIGEKTPGKGIHRGNLQIENGVPVIGSGGRTIRDGGIGPTAHKDKPAESHLGRQLVVAGVVVTDPDQVLTVSKAPSRKVLPSITSGRFARPWEKARPQIKKKGKEEVSNNLALHVPELSSANQS